MGVTPNRGYPYPNPADPTNVPVDLQELAESFDTDLRNVQDTIETRPMFRVSASSTVLYGPAATMTLPFDNLDVNNGGALLEPISPGQTNFTPLIAGLWEITCTVAYPARLSITTVSLRLFNPTEFAGNSTNQMPTNETATMQTSSVGVFTGTGTGNSVFAVLTGNAAGTLATWPIGTRALTGILLART